MSFNIILSRIILQVQKGKFLVWRGRWAFALLFLLLGVDSLRASLPPGWSDADIGSPGDAGFGSDINGNWIVPGGGSDVWGSADQFNLVNENLASDGAIIGRVTSVQNTDPGTGWSKAGLMFRNDITAGAVNAYVNVTAGQGVNFQYRTAAGGSTVNNQIVGVAAPVWLELARSGDLFSGYYSTDGTNWIQIGGTTVIMMNGSALAGLAVSAHNNSALNTSVFTNVSVSAPTFGLYRELWTNLNGSIGTLAALTNTTDNPAWPSNPAASYTHIFTNLETEINSGMVNYGQRLRAFVVPPVTGFYTFWIASDDTSQLLLSANETSAGAVPIASQTSYTASEQWTEFPDQQSAAIKLQAGCRYYIETRMQQGPGGDNLSVRWQLPNGSFEQPMTAVSAAGTLLIPFNGLQTAPGIFIQPTNTTVIENQNATFSLLVTNGAAVSYQWMADGTNVTGGTLPVYTMTNASLALNNGQVYTCVVSNSINAVTSAPVSLTVVRDTNAPTVSRIYNLGPTNVEIVFSKPVAQSQAANPANYSFTNTLGIVSASLGRDGETVTLVTAPLTYESNYAIFINDIQDLASIPNTIATNTEANFEAVPYVSQDIGNPAVASLSNVTTNGVTVSSDGNSIGGLADQFNFEYQLQTGNFDVSIRLAGLSLCDLWASAGLMARATLDPGSSFAAALATPGMNGAFLMDRTASNTVASSAGDFPVNYPNTWLRLSRSGNVFTGFASYDGLNWTSLGTVTIAMPSQIYLGMAVSSHATNQAVTAQFLNLVKTPANVAVVTVANPHEPLGPSSRRSCIAISEIMYKPAARTDGNNTEYVELYNSAPWFHDISGYSIVCADMNYTFPQGTVIPGGGFLVAAASPEGVANVYGITNVVGPYAGSLKKSETLQLFDEETNLLLTVSYSATYPWPVAADGTGHSIVLAHPTYGEGDPRAWDISDVKGGSPGAMESYRPNPLRNVVINEWLAHSENPGVLQFVELYNHSAQTNDLSGCILTDDFTTNKFVIPAGTLIGPGGFVSFNQTQLGFLLNPEGETLYFIKPDGTRVLDAVQYEPQADGVAFGRWPDGANDFYALTSPTPGTNNSAIVIGNIVINELMYDPISENDGDQYIELFNQSTNTVSLANWQFTAGVTFTFPPNAAIAPQGYVVVAENMANLLGKYTNLNDGNTFGDYGGKLSHNGERVALSMPQSLYGTNTIYVVQDEVTYGTGGRWGEWSSGGGSSLELIDPHANHRLAANWADSDETQKSSWVDIETTGVLDNGSNYESSIAHAQMGLLDVGECLVDNIEVDYNGSNYVSNPTFESGLGNWALQGCCVRSSLEPSGYQSSQSLHIRCSDRVWTGDNSCQVTLNTNTLSAGKTATLRFKARWLRGWPEVLFRLNGNWIEASGAMAVPSNLGTPGAPNSAYVTNAGPAVYSVTHTPTIPAANQPVVVTARVHDPDGLRSLTLNYRIDPSKTYTAVAMNDSGTGGDALAKDGVFSATIPAQSANTVAAFYISATDLHSAMTRFPALRPADNEPTRECVVLFGDGNPGGSFGVYHIWITQTNITRWANLSDLSNEGNDFTFVNGSRVIYNAQGRFAGSPYHQIFDTPVGNLCHYKWEFPDDDLFLGTADFNKIHQPGNAPGDDPSWQREQIANTFLRSLGAPWLNRRYVAVYANGNRRGGLMEDAQVPGSDIVKEHFPNDTDGFLYKMQPWFEFAPTPAGPSLDFDNQSWCNLLPYTTTGGSNKVARYRYDYEIRRTPTSDLDFTNIFSLVAAANASGTPNYVAGLENMANMENWMRVFAANHAAGNWDSFGAQNAQNLYGYIGAEGTKYTLLMWDFNIVLGNDGSWGPGQNLFTLNSQDTNMMNIYNCPTFLRMYWRALESLANGPLNPASSAPLATAKYNAFVANGLSVEDPGASILPWLGEARSSILYQLAAADASGFSVSQTSTVSNDVAYVTGTAPVAVDTVLINGVSYPITWTSLTTWMVAVPLTAGTNTLSITGVDIHGRPIAGAAGNATVIYKGTNSSPVGQVVINEIMYNPIMADAQYVELYNISSNYTFDLSGWQAQGLSYLFPQGASLPPLSFLVLAANVPAFAGAYGITNPVFDVFSGALPTNGTVTLSLIDAASNVITKVQYESNPPWPGGANGAGGAIEIIDPHQDNWRVGNWLGVSFSPGQTNRFSTALPPFPPLWLNEIQPENITGPTNSAGQHASWVELYNRSSNVVSLNGLYLADNYSNLTEWPFPPNAAIGAGQFEIFFPTGLTLSNGSGSVALSRVYSGQGQVLDYMDYTNLPANYSYGSYPDGQSFNRQQFFVATPDGTNDGGAAGYIGYFAPNSIYTQNFDSLPDPGVTTVNTANPATIGAVTYSPRMPLDFSLPVSSGGLGLSSFMPGWYGWAATAMKVGASAGDQTTGGVISFGATNSASTNRSLGLLATSTTGITAFGVRILNETQTTLTTISVSFAGELWRQQTTAKSLVCSYYVDLTGTNAFSPNNISGPLPALNVSFPTGASAAGLSGPLLTLAVGGTNQGIVNCPPGAALWLTWQLSSAASGGQGIGIDNFSFAAAGAQLQPPLLSIAQSNSSVIVSWPGSNTGYVLQFNNSDLSNSNAWQSLGGNFSNAITLPLTNGYEFFRLKH